MSRWCAPLWPNKPLAMHQCDSAQSFSTPAKSLGCSLEVNPSSSSQEVCELHYLLHDFVRTRRKELPWAMCTPSLSLMLQNPRGKAKIRSRTFLGLRISESVDGPRHKLLIKEPGQLRLDSGSLPAGWFPLPDAVGMLLGCHPSASRSLPSTSLEQLWDLGRLLYDYNAVTVEGDRAS